MTDFDELPLALANGKRVEEGRQWLGIVGAGPAADDDGIVVRALTGEKRHAGQVEHLQNARVTGLELQRETEDVEVGERSARFERPERDAARSHALDHVGPGHEGALAGDGRLFVEDEVQQPKADVAHPDLVGLRKAERPGQSRLVQGFAAAVDFAAHVTGRLLAGEDEGVEVESLKAHGVSGSGLGLIRPGEGEVAAATGALFLSGRDDGGFARFNF